MEIINSTFKNIPWGNILEAKYAVEGKSLYFLVKWNGSIPISIDSDSLIKPRYLIHRKAKISWTIDDGSISIFSKGELIVGDNNFVLFEFLQGSTNFQYATHSIPFVNKTTAAFKILYKRGAIPVEALSEISINPASSYIAYHQFQSDLESLSDLPESPPDSIKIDGNISDWSNSDVNSIQMNGDYMNLTENFIFPTYDNILVTRTLEGIYGAVSLSNNNFTKFIVDMKNISANIYWVTVLAEFNQSYAADYAFEVYLSFNHITGYSIHNVSITLNAGTGFSPSIVKYWQLQYDQQGTDSCFECFFPFDIISSLYGFADSIYFYSSMLIEWNLV